MKLPKFSSAIFSVFFLVLTGCGNDKVSGPNPDVVIRPGTVEYYFKQAKSVPEAREKLGFLNKALAAVSNEKDTVLPHLLDFKIYYHDQIKEFDSALYFTDKLIEVAQFQKDTHYEAMAYYRKAFIYKDLKIEEKNFENHFKALQFFLKINDSSMAGASLSDMAISQSQMTDYTGAQESATEALKYLNKNKDSEEEKVKKGFSKKFWHRSRYFNRFGGEFRHSKKYTVNRAIWIFRTPYFVLE